MAGFENWAISWTSYVYRPLNCQEKALKLKHQNTEINYIPEKNMNMTFA